MNNLKTVKRQIQNGVDIHFDNNLALEIATVHNHQQIITFLKNCMLLEKLEKAEKQ